MARRGALSCAVGLVLLSTVPRFALERSATAVRLLQMAAICLAFTSATVVSSLTSFASLQCDEVVDQVTGKPVHMHPRLSKGVALGMFRSAGQLGRAIGPLLGAWFRNGQSAILLSLQSLSMCLILDLWSVSNVRSQRRGDDHIDSVYAISGRSPE